ncbi:hypothetical protein OG948_52015 (plasmid) [Embleya sp. NBC_00888]|uniref:hypothetical protein n=1 Tax=Embleya sp. NBC_00888 TaxID=2975960 RepID=UPI002F90F913|nr:hypothetical protein OG948_52015 [Embleya sp. NBC_00888]
MYALAHLRRIALAIGAAIVLAAGPIGSAHAATGTFTYETVDGEGFRLVDPADGECLPLVGGARIATNDTTTVAKVYADQGCEEGPYWLLGPHTTLAFAAPIPHSVKFG